MPKRNMRDLIKKETSSQTSKATKSDSNKGIEKQTDKVTDSGSTEESNLQSTDNQDSGSNEETELQLNQPSESISHKDTEKQTLNDTESVSHKDTRLQSTEQEESSQHKETEQQTNKQPKYLTLLRKEARLREDQFDDLTALARTLNRRRKGGERITENTLIRLAVDLLLKEADQLEGTTEEELRGALDL